MVPQVNSEWPVNGFSIFLSQRTSLQSIHLSGVLFDFFCIVAPCKSLQDNVRGNDNYLLLVNFSVLQDIFKEVSRCPDCDEHVTLSDNLNNRMGKLIILNWIIMLVVIKRIFIVQDSVKELKKQIDVKHLRLMYVLLFPFLKSVVFIEH